MTMTPHAKGVSSPTSPSSLAADADVEGPIDWDAEFSAPDVGLATRMLLRVLLLGALGTFSLMYLSWYMMPIGVVLMGLCFYGLQVISYDCNRACYLPWAGANTILGAAVSLPLLRSAGPLKVGADPVESMMLATWRHAPVWILALAFSLAAIVNGHTLLLLKFWLVPFLAMHLSAAGSFFFSCCGIQPASAVAAADGSSSVGPVETGTESAFSLLFPEINLHVPPEEACAGPSGDGDSTPTSSGSQQTKAQALASELQHFDRLLQSTPIYKLPSIAKRVTELASTFFSRHSELDDGEQEELIALLNHRIEKVSPIQRIVRQFLFWDKRDWAVGAAVAIFAGLALLKWSLSQYDVPWAETLPEYGWLPLLIVLPCFSLLSSAPKSLDEMQSHIKAAVAALSDSVAAVSNPSSANTSPPVRPITINSDDLASLSKATKKLDDDHDNDNSRRGSADASSEDDNFPAVYHRRSLQPHRPNKATPAKSSLRKRATPLKAMTPSHVVRWMRSANMSNLAAQWEKAGFVVDGDLLAHASSAEDVEGLAPGVPLIFRSKLLSMIQDARDGGVDLSLLVEDDSERKEDGVGNRTAKKIEFTKDEPSKKQIHSKQLQQAAVDAAAATAAATATAAAAAAARKEQLAATQRHQREMRAAEARAQKAEAQVQALQAQVAQESRRRADTAKDLAQLRRTAAEVASLRQAASTHSAALLAKQRLVDTLQANLRSREQRITDLEGSKTSLARELASVKRQLSHAQQAGQKRDLGAASSESRIQQHAQLKQELESVTRARDLAKRQAADQAAKVAALEAQRAKDAALVQQLQAAGYQACTAADAASEAKRQNRPVDDNRIAVVGYSCILPGGENVAESWEMIRDGLDNIRDLPDDRVDVTAYYNPDKTVPDKIYCTRGGFVPDFDFNPREFNFNMLQMEDTDVNQTLTLVKVKEALADAGIPCSTVKGKAAEVEKTKKNIGCVLGIGGGQKASHEFYSRLNYTVVEKVLRKMKMPEADIAKAVEKYKANFPEWRLDSFPGFLGNVTSGRVTNVFNLDGMNCVVDAACASSLIAIKVAMDEILAGDCETMIAGATCTDCSLGMYMAFSKTPVFSRKQSVTAYDKDTGGMLIGEGSVMFVLKRLSAAEAAGDRIHAVIRACASSSDGKAPGIYAPTISGQEQAIRRAYEKAGVDPASVTLVEGHGTGTPVGDAVELTALKNVLGEGAARESDPRRQRVAVGSIKSNIGHLKSVAGCAGLIKVVLALKHKVLPQTINVELPPKLRDGTTIQESALYINTARRPWFTRPGMPRRAGVSSFGFGGANYHCVVEEYEHEHGVSQRGSEASPVPYRVHQLPVPVIISAPNEAGLGRVVQQELKELQRHLEFAPPKSTGHAQLELELQPDNSKKQYSAGTALTQKSTTFDKRQAARALVLFKHRFALKGAGEGRTPTAHARVGFQADSLQQTCDALAAITAQLRKGSRAGSWSLPKHRVYFRPQGMAPNAKVAALFTGQGAQYLHMFSDVAQNWPEMRRRIVEMDDAFAEAHGKLDRWVVIAF